MVLKSFENALASHLLSDLGVREGDSGAEPDAVEYPVLKIHMGS